MTLAVVTICRDPGDSMAATAASIAAQSAPLRWIVVDGASRDGTQEQLRALTRPPDILHSGPDAGIADAFNIGLRLADDDDVLFLNAGDRFAATTALEELNRAWDRAAFRWVVGGVRITDQAGRDLGERRPPSGVPARRLVSRGNRIPHPAVLAPAPLLRELGGFSPDFRYAMDYDLWLRAIARGVEPQVVATMVAVFALGGRSGDIRARLAEDRRARRMSGMSDGGLAEAWLTCGGWARILSGRLRRSLMAYRINRWLGW